jgi:transposase
LAGRASTAADSWARGNHSAHISRETRTWLAAQVPGRFQFTFAPKHGSWLNLVEGFVSKFARSVLRHIRVASKQELKERIMAGIEDINRHPVIHTWSYKLAEAAWYDSNQENADLVVEARRSPAESAQKP